jgi:hypothetical protein
MLIELYKSLARGGWTNQIPCLTRFGVFDGIVVEMKICIAPLIRTMLFLFLQLIYSFWLVI